MKEIKKIFPDVPPPVENRIAQTIIAGQDYMSRHIPGRTSVWLLFGQQLKYISPFLWAAQFSALVIVVYAVMLNEPNLYTAQNILFQLAPLTALLAIPELLKDVFHDMSELERSCKNSGSTVLLMRLIAVGGINLFALSLFVGILAGVWGYNFPALALYAVVPYNLVNVICLGVVQLFKIKGKSAALAVSLLSAGVTWVLPNTGLNITNYVLLAVFIATTIILSVQVWAIIKKNQTEVMSYGIDV